MNFFNLNIFSLSLFLIAKCQDFCDDKFKNNLIDSVFNFNDTIYAFRKPENVWLLRPNKNTENQTRWFQIENPIHLSDLFYGYKKPSFESAFCAPDYVKCKETDENCEDSNFDATNVTFVFDGNSYYIFRRLEERVFMSVSDSDTNIPWKANRANTSSVAEFFKISGRIDGSVFFYPEGKDSPKRMSIIFSDSSVCIFEINEKDIISFMIHHIENISDKKKARNGAISIDEDILLVIDNKLWKYTINSQFLEEMGQNTWDFFNCDNMVITSSTDMTSSPIETTSELDSEAVALLTTREQMNATTASSPTNVTTKISGTAPGKSVKPCSTDTDSEYRNQMKVLLMILLTIISVTCILMTLFAAVCFNYLKTKHSNKRRDQRKGSVITIKTIKSETESDLESHLKNKKESKATNHINSNEELELQSLQLR